MDEEEEDYTIVRDMTGDIGDEEFEGIAIDIFKQQPEIGEKVFCEVEMWRYGELHHTEKLLAKYIGWNKITNCPMFDIETYDEAYALVVGWGKKKKGEK